MRRASITLAFGSLLWIATGAAQGFGFGRASSPTVLGQNLNFTTVVRIEPDESLVPECVVAEVISGDNRLAAQSVRVSVEPGGTPSERLLRVTSTVRIDEPVVTVTVTLGCTNRISRKFVAFIDPPSVSLAQSSIVESSPAEAPRADSSPSAPAVAVAQASPTTVAPGAAAAPKPKPKPRVSRPAPAPAVVAAAPATAPRSADTPPPSQARPAAPRAPGPRLQLEAAAPIQRPASAPAATPKASPAALPPATAAVSPAATASSVDATVALLTEQSEALAKERARLLALEESLNRLRAESQATQTTLATLQARLKTAETERYSNPLVYALAWLAAGLALAVAVLWWRQGKMRREGQWWAPPTQASAAEERDRDRERDRVQMTEPPAPPPSEPRRAPIITAAAPDTATPPTWADSRLTEAPPDMVPEPRRDLSVEELIDLEQQAEFFVVLGQDEAAIDLLMGHVRSTGGISPLPYLKLLEIYKRRGDRSAYERIRERFNRRFNAYAPDWDTDLQQGKALEDYPATMVKLEGLWGMPQRVMETLDASLFRRDETEEAYDLPAYRELLFLYSVARDFTTRAAAAAETSGGVDLLLPIDSPEPVPVARLSAATRATPRHDARTDFGQPTLDMEMTSPMPVDLEPPRRFERSNPPDLSLNSDFLDLPELPTGPGKLGPADKK